MRPPTPQFSLEIFAKDTLSDEFTSSTTDDSDRDYNNTLEPTMTADLPPGTTLIPYAATTTVRASAQEQYKETYHPIYDNETQFDKSLLRTTESTWEPVRPSLLRFGLAPPMRRGRPKCCRRVRENEKKEARKMKCGNGSLFFRDARGRRRRKCRRRSRCKRRCKQHYSNTAWGIVGTMMKGLDFFIPKLEFKFHTGTLVFGTKFFSGLVPFLQAKIQGMRFFYELFEPLLDGVLDVLDFSRIGFRSMSLDDDDDDDEDDEPVNGQKTGSASKPTASAIVVDEKIDAETLEDYDDSDILPDLSLAKNDLQSLPEDEDEGYDSPKDEPVDEDYGIDEDWDGEDDDDEEEEEEEEEFDDTDSDEDFQKRITLPRPQKIIKRPVVGVRPRPTRKTILSALITPPNDVDGLVHGDQQTIQDFMKRIKGEDVTVYHSAHSNLVGNTKQAVADNKLPFNDTHVLNVDNLVLNINARPTGELYEDDVEYQEEPSEDLDDDKLIETPSLPVKRVKSRPPVFSSFGAFFGAISEAFDAYFSGTY